MKDDLECSFYEGLIEGQDIRSFAGACPYQHDRPNLRLNWLEGFAAGRQSMVTTQQAEKTAKHSLATDTQALTLPYFDGRVETFASFDEVGCRLEELQEQCLMLTLDINHPTCFLRPIEKFNRMLRRHLNRQVD